MGFGVTTRRHRHEHHHHGHPHPHGHAQGRSPLANGTGGAPYLPLPLGSAGSESAAETQHVELDLEPGPGGRDSVPASEDPTLSVRERREASAAETAAAEMTKRKRWNMSTWSKAVELWKDLDVLGLVALTVGCILFLLPFTLATKRPESWGDGASPLSLLVPTRPGGCP